MRLLPPRRPARLRALSLLLSATGLGACGGAAPPVVSTSPPTPPTAPAPAPDAFPPPGTFGTPGLAEYAAANLLPPTPEETSLRPVWSPSAAGSASLACTAREYAIRFAGDRADPGPGTVAALAEHCGLWASPPDVFAFTAPSLEAARAQLEKAPAEQRSRPSALGAVAHPGGAVTVAVATPPQGVVFDPLPRRVQPGTPLRLTGQRIGAGSGGLWLYAASGTREATERPVVVGPDGRFEAELPAPEAGATAVYELVRADGPFLRSLGVLRISTEAPAAAYPPPATPMANPGRPAQEAALLGAANVERKSVGLPPLQPLSRGPDTLDPWLDAIAAGSATAAPVGLVDDRGWPFGRLRYTFTAGVTIGEAITALAATPLGRRALFATDDTHLAFGVRPFGGAPGQDVVVVSLQKFHAPAAADARAALLTAVNGRRKTTGLAPLAEAAPLSAVAQQLADDALAGRVRWEGLVDAAGKQLMQRQVAISAFGAGGATQVAFDPAALVAEQGLLAKDMRAVGVGVAAGPLPGQTQPQVVLVYVVADQVPKP
jgi:hypothetical protein